MSDQTPPKSHDDTSAIEPHRKAAEHLRRVADSCRSLGDPMLMAKAWDEPVTSDVQPATTSPRRFGKLENLSVPDTFDDPLPDAEVAAWEDDSLP
jgi:hypothetical protein